MAQRTFQPASRRRRLRHSLRHWLGPGCLPLLAALLSGCGLLHPAGWRDLMADPGLELKRDGRPLVITSFTVPRAMAQAVACGKLQVESLLPAGAEIHAHQPGDRERHWLQQADLVLVHGLDLHPWLPPLLKEAGSRPTVDVAAGIQPRRILEGERAGKPDPHAWMSPRQAQTYVRNIRDAFIALDPQHAATYRSCAARYSEQLVELDRQLREELGRLPAQQRTLVSCEGSLAYLSADYGLQEVYLWPSQGTPQASKERLEQVASQVRTLQVPAVFCESTYDDSQQRQLARESGARFGGTLFVDSLSSLDGLAPNYLELLRHNLSLIKKGLGSRPS